jgi:protease-4
MEKFAEEYGITLVTVKSGKHKDTGNPFREFTEDDRALWQEIIDESYDQFVQIVAEGRHMSEEEVRQIADGRICTGKQGQEMKLVDNLGYLPDATKRAAELGGIEGEPRIVDYQEESVGLFDAFSSSGRQPSPVEELERLLRFQAGPPLMYLYVGP